MISGVGETPKQRNSPDNQPSTKVQLVYTIISCSGWYWEWKKNKAIAIGVWKIIILWLYSAYLQDIRDTDREKKKKGTS